MQDVETKLNGLIDSLFCENCVFLDFMKGEVICNQFECSCSKQIEFSSLLDFYANLYYHLDNINLANYETFILFNDIQIDKQIRTEIKDLWMGHLVQYSYDNNEHEMIHDATVELIKESLFNSQNNQEIILKCMNWLYTLDTHLEDLKNFLEGQKDINKTRPIKTNKGVIVFKRQLGLNDYLKTEHKLIPPVDPNYISLKSNIHNFFLAKEKYAYYDVSYNSLTGGSVERLNRSNIGNLKIGFLPGDFNFEDYHWNYDNNVDDDFNEEIYFHFDKVMDQTAYYDKVIKAVKEILKQNPDIIILPELFAPEDLQRKILDVVKDEKRRLQNQNQNLNTFLVLPGSFHFFEGGKIYNRSLISTGNGQILFEVNKMNKFKILRNDKNEGALECFKDKEGIEKISFEKREIQLIETPIGRIGIFICVDLLNFNIEEILIDRHVDLIFVMTMTPRPASGKFLRKMQELGERNHSTVIICNNLGTENISEDEVKKGAYRIVAYFPGLKGSYQSNNNYEVVTIEEMVSNKKS